MFNTGNQIVVKSTNEAGYIYSIVDTDVYCVHVVDDNSNKLLRVKMLHGDDIELKSCRYGVDGKCQYVTTGSRGSFACMYCELDREGVIENNV